MSLPVAANASLHCSPLPLPLLLPLLLLLLRRRQLRRQRLQRVAQRLQPRRAGRRRPLLLTRLQHLLQLLRARREEAHQLKQRLGERRARSQRLLPLQIPPRRQHRLGGAVLIVRPKGERYLVVRVFGQSEAVEAEQLRICQRPVGEEELLAAAAGPGGAHAQHPVLIRQAESHRVRVVRAMVEQEQQGQQRSLSRGAADARHCHRVGLPNLHRPAVESVVRSNAEACQEWQQRVVLLTSSLPEALRLLSAQRVAQSFDGAFAQREPGVQSSLRQSAQQRRERRGVAATVLSQRPDDERGVVAHPFQVHCTLARGDPGGGREGAENVALVDVSTGSRSSQPVEGGGVEAAAHPSRLGPALQWCVHSAGQERTAALAKS